MATPQELKVAVMGDVMTGRLIDQLFPTYCEPDKDERLGRGQPKSHEFIWGNVLPLIRDANLRIANLETSITTHPRKWPNKAFNYRMHPDNIKCLTTAKIDYCSLANNHILDYSYEGMYDTIRYLKDANIKFAGAGGNLKESQVPALVNVTPDISMACFSFADHFSYWEAGPTTAGINFVDPEEYNEAQRAAKIKEIKELIQPYREKVDLVTVSIHWGSNYRWKPPKEFVLFAHDLIEQCGVDLIHGHSSHHVQGIEIYKSKPIIYGCGDFVDDYAVDDTFRNDLGFLYMLSLNPQTKRWTRLTLVPTHIRRLQVNLAEGREKAWLTRTIKSLSMPYGTTISDDLSISIE